MNHGRRLTQREYEQAVVGLHTSGSDKPDEAQRRRRELDLTIDHRLGINFPPERREALWRIQRRIDSSHARLAAWWLVSLIAPSALRKRTNRVSDFVLHEYAKELTPEEMQAYFGEST